MFRYLFFFGAAFYLALLIGGEDRGQQRMGLAGAYAIPLAPPPPAEAAPDPEPLSEATSVPMAPTVAPPADTLRVLPATTLAPLADALPDALPMPADAMQAVDPDPAFRIITADAANVRDGANRSAAIIGRLERGEIVQTVDEVGDWVRIRIEGDGVEGFVHGSLISADTPELTTTTLFPVAD